MYISSLDVNTNYTKSRLLHDLSVDLFTNIVKLNKLSSVSAVDQKTNIIISVRFRRVFN